MKSTMATATWLNASNPPTEGKLHTPPWDRSGDRRRKRPPILIRAECLSEGFLGG